jgi:hypothetical protein
MFAERPSNVALYRLRAATFSGQKPIFGDDFKVKPARKPWPRY